MSITDDLPPAPPPSLRSPFGIGWKAPEPPPSTPLPSPASSPENPPTSAGPAPASGPDSDEASEWDEAHDPTPPPGSSPASDAVKVELLTEEELKQWARGGVAAAGEKAHDVFAVTEGQQAVDLYKTTAKEQASIGDPIASIAGRHQGIGGKVSPDTKDLLSLMTGLVAYGTRQINLRNEARAIDAGAVPVQAVDL